MSGKLHEQLLKDKNVRIIRSDAFLSQKIKRNVQGQVKDRSKGKVMLQIIKQMATLVH
jgi:hypothetical protein